MAIALWSRDEPPPDLSDLVVVPRAVTDDQNAFHVLCAVAARIDRSPWANDGKLFAEISEGKKWDAGKAAGWLAANSHLWSEMKRAAELPLSQAPLWTSPDDASTLPIVPLRELAKLSNIRARHLLDRGEKDAAFTWLAVNLQAAHQIQDSRGALMIWLVGSAVHQEVRQSIDALAVENSITAEAAQLLLRTLESTRPIPAGLSDSIRNENAFAKGFLESFTDDKKSRQGEEQFDRLSTVSRQFPLLFKFNRTQRIHGDFLRKYIGLVDADWPTLRLVDSDFEDLLGLGWRRWNPDNAAGRVLLATTAPVFSKLLVARLRAQSAISATQALLAVRLYQIEHGALPETLSELVPKYLPSVPLDYFDRAPIRYSRPARAIWSVGKSGLTAAQLDTNLDPSEVVLRLPSPVL